jgi:uncharacterized protein (TIGR03083 family)
MATELAVRSAARPRARALDRDVAMTSAATEYARVQTLFDSITAGQWALPTDCPGWDVRAVAGHVLGLRDMGDTAGLRGIRENAHANPARDRD